MDERLFHFLYEARGGGLTSIAAALTVLGGGWITLGLVPLLFFRRVRAPALGLGLTLGVTAGVVALLKAIVQRVRPCHALTGVHCLWGPAPTDFSFPSGHAAGSFAFVAFVGAALWMTSGEASAPSGRARAARRFGLLAIGLGLASGIALSRVYLGVHFPGDVAAGACLGGALGLVGARLYVRRTSAVAPASCS